MITWKIDNVNLITYGVGVSSAKGVLDIPKTDILTHDWLDENGLEFTNYSPYINKQEREIVLSCFIEAGDYADFSTKVQTFYTAISGVERILSCDYADLITVHVKNEIHINRITAYQEDKQVGLFKLRLTVMGDTKKKFWTVYKPDGTVRTTIGYFNDFKLHQYLMGDNFINGTFERNSMFTCEENDYIRLANGDYVLLSPPDIRKESSNKFTSTMRFDARWTRLKNVQFRIGGTSETYYWGTMSDMINRLIENVNRSGFITITLRNVVPTTVLKNHHISGQDCLTTLKDICELYELEFRFVKATGATEYYLDIAEKISVSSGLSFAYGKGNGLYHLDRNQITDEEQVTVLFAEGSTRNLPLGYGYMRLQMPVLTGGFLQKNVLLYGYKEKTKFFDDIFPELDRVLTGYTFIDTPTETDKKQFIVYDNLFPYDLNAKDINGDTIYLVPGMAAKIVFNSGALAGFDFEIRRYDHTTGGFWLSQFVDEYGNRFPNDLTFPAIGNEYAVIDIKLPQPLVDIAESRLQTAAQAWLDNHDAKRVVYSGMVDPNYYWNEDPLYLEPGSTALITDTDFNLTEDLRISESIYDFAAINVSLKFSEHRLISNYQELQLKVIRFAKALQKSGFLDVMGKRKKLMSLGTLRSILFDPVDNKLNTENIRDESIDPRTLALDSGVPQISIDEALVEVNVDGNEDKVDFNSGMFRILNFYAKDRWTIKKMKDLLQGYNPARAWTLAYEQKIIPTANAHFVYVKVNIAPLITVGEIVLSEDPIEVKSDIDNGNLYYKVGQITSKASPRYASMLFGNVKILLEAPKDGKQYARKNGTWVEVVSGGGGLPEQSFEYCVVGGVAQTETLDLYATSSFLISKLIAECDGTLTSVTVKIGAIAVTGINAVSVGTLAIFTATAANSVVAGDRITIEIGTGYTGTPTIIKGKLVMTT